jgi:hypothetical protein
MTSSHLNGNGSVERFDASPDSRLDHPESSGQ